ncbi:hypothetical protein FEM48_Zijuj07G0003700 [Ziziphus jujuba var. spinosa]|uniref:Uncharacterized protein n=1 Tax=Ziziphus jujuba var. spinosa TaxID=714518 RepID=A0A978V1C7_ZIZJJ|nr:hypothetical protein FEM48_Zijuj07G0003700 [Ziziphus jujuba var. spinosa]
MPNIRCNVNLPKDLDCLPKNLKFLKWKGYPLESLSSNFYPSELVELNMCHSRIEQLWEGEEVFSNLKFMKLSHSQNLIKTPNFIGVPNLETLVLEGCRNLVEVHPSIGFLEKLRLLNLKDCSSLTSSQISFQWNLLKFVFFQAAQVLKKFQM